MTPEQKPQGRNVGLSAGLEAKPGWQCDLGNGEWDHDWQVIADWYGDPDVINGTADCSFLRCRVCGAEDHEADVRQYEADHYDDCL